MEFKNSNQFKGFIRNEAKRLGISVTNAYKTYLSRTILERFSLYDNKNFLIKGSASQFAYLGKLVRAVVDLDVATVESFDYMVNSLIDVLKTRNNDVFKLDLSGPVHQTNTGIYKIGLEATFEKFKMPIGIDFQEKYDRLIEPTWQEIPPIFIGDKVFEAQVPSLEEYLAEKLYNIIERDKTDTPNTRVKDFYDIFKLYNSNYDPDKFAEYFKEMIILKKKEHITLNTINPEMLNEEYINNHLPLWNNAASRYDFVDRSVDFTEAVYCTRDVLRDQLLRNNMEMPSNTSSLNLRKTVK